MSLRCFAPAVDLADAEAFARRLAGVFDETFAVELTPVALRASIGIAFREPGDHDLTELMKNADLALYRAKADGGARHRFFNPEMAEAVRKRRELESDLRRAIGPASSSWSTSRSSTSRPASSTAAKA